MVDDLGLVRAVFPTRGGLRLGLGSTLKYGPSPAVRWFVPRATLVGGAAGGAYYLLKRSKREAEEKD